MKRLDKIGQGSFLMVTGYILLLIGIMFFPEILGKIAEAQNNYILQQGFLSVLKNWLADIFFGSLPILILLVFLIWSIWVFVKGAYILNKKEKSDV